MHATFKTLAAYAVAHGFNVRKQIHPYDGYDNLVIAVGSRDVLSVIPFHSSAIGFSSYNSLETMDCMAPVGTRARCTSGRNVESVKRSIRRLSAEYNTRRRPAVTTRPLF